MFERAIRCASALGMSRSELFSRAVEHYLDQLDAQSLTRQIDAALASIEADDSAAAAVTAGRRRRARDEDTW